MRQPVAEMEGWAEWGGMVAADGAGLVAAGAFTGGWGEVAGAGGAAAAVVAAGVLLVAVSPVVVGGAVVSGADLDIDVGGAVVMVWGAGCSVRVMTGWASTPVRLSELAEVAPWVMALTDHRPEICSSVSR